MFQNFNGHLMYFLWDEYSSFKTSGTCAAAFNFSGSCRSSLLSTFVLQMYLIKYIKKITRKPEVAETASNHLSFSFYPSNSNELGQLSLWIKLIAQLLWFKRAAGGSEYVCPTFESPAVILCLQAMGQQQHCRGYFCISSKQANGNRMFVAASQFLWTTFISAHGNSLDFQLTKY